MAHPGNLPVLRTDPSDPDFYNTPADVYARIHADGGTVWWENYGHVCFAGFETVSKLLRDKRFGRQPLDPPEFQQHLKAFRDFEDNSMLELEAPAHTRLRRLINRPFVSRQIETLRPMITRLAHELIDGFEASETVDLIDSYATPIPLYVIGHMLGMPRSDAQQLLVWSHQKVAMYQFNRTYDTEVKASEATIAFSDYVRTCVEERKTSPGDDLISQLIAISQDGDQLSRDELVSTVILLLEAGHEATVHGIGNGVRRLIGEPSAWRGTTADADWLRIGEELLRLDAPLHMFTRFVYEDCTVDGVELSRGDVIGLLLGAANRDPARFCEPNAFRPDRDDAGHVSFGAGIHFCIGAPLARLEINIALQTLFERLPGIALDGPAAYADRYHFQGHEKLMIRPKPGD